MKRKFLEEMGLSKEQVDAILDENSQDIGKAKAELETAKKDNESLKAQLEENNKKFSDLQKSTADTDSLKKEIENLQNQNKADSEKHIAEMKQLKMDMAVETALIGAKAKNTKAVKALLDLENAELAEDGTIKGLAEQILKLSKADDSKFLFASAMPNVKGAKIGEGIQGFDDVHTSEMTYSQIPAYLKENPDAKI